MITTKDNGIRKVYGLSPGIHAQLRSAFEAAEVHDSVQLKMAVKEPNELHPEIDPAKVIRSDAGALAVYARQMLAIVDQADGGNAQFTGRRDSWAPEGFDFSRYKGRENEPLVDSFVKPLMTVAKNASFLNRRAGDEIHPVIKAGAFNAMQKGLWTVFLNNDYANQQFVSGGVTRATSRVVSVGKQTTHKIPSVSAIPDGTGFAI